MDLFNIDSKVHLNANCCREDFIQLRAKMASITAPFLGHSMVYFQEGNAAFGSVVPLRVNCCFNITAVLSPLWMWLHQLLILVL